jgi:hypothetical protein
MRRILVLAAAVGWSDLAHAQASTTIECAEPACACECRCDDDAAVEDDDDDLDLEFGVPDLDAPPFAPATKFAAQ